MKFCITLLTLLSTTSALARLAHADWGYGCGQSGDFIDFKDAKNLRYMESYTLLSGCCANSVLSLIG